MAWSKECNPHLLSHVLQPFMLALFLPSALGLSTVYGRALFVTIMAIAWEFMEIGSDGGSTVGESQGAVLIDVSNAVLGGLCASLFLALFNDNSIDSALSISLNKQGIRNLIVFIVLSAISTSIIYIYTRNVWEDRAKRCSIGYKVSISLIFLLFVGLAFISANVPLNIYASGLSYTLLMCILYIVLTREEYVLLAHAIILLVGLLVWYSRSGA